MPRRRQRWGESRLFRASGGGLRATRMGKGCGSPRDDAGSAASIASPASAWSENSRVPGLPVTAGARHGVVPQRRRTPNLLWGTDGSEIRLFQGPHSSSASADPTEAGLRGDRFGLQHSAGIFRRAPSSVPQRLEFTAHAGRCRDWLGRIGVKTLL